LDQGGYQSFLNKAGQGFRATGTGLGGVAVDVSTVGFRSGLGETLTGLGSDGISQTGGGS
jgi:hypothetical protein